MATALLLDPTNGSAAARSGLALRVFEGTIVATFSLLALSSLWLCAGLITQTWDETALLHWFFPTGVGLFMALIATTAWLVLLPGLVACVRDEFRTVVALFARLMTKEP